MGRCLGFFAVCSRIVSETMFRDRFFWGSQVTSPKRQVSAYNIIDDQEVGHKDGFIVHSHWFKSCFGQLFQISVSHPIPSWLVQTRPLLRVKKRRSNPEAQPQNLRNLALPPIPFRFVQTKGEFIGFQAFSIPSRFVQTRVVFNPSLKLCIQGWWFWIGHVFKPANDAFKGEHKKLVLQPVNLLILIWPRSDIMPMRPGPRPSSAAAAVRPRFLLSHLLWISDCLNNHPSGRDLLDETSWKCHWKKTSRAAAAVPQMQQQLCCNFFICVNGLALVCLRLSSNASMAMNCSDYLSSYSVSSTCKRNSWLAPLSQLPYVS